MGQGYLRGDPLSRPGDGAGAEPDARRDAELDESLLRRVREGDLVAFERLVACKRGRAFRLARHVVGEDEDAKDVVQLAFIRVWRRARRYREGSGFDPWFHRIVMNLAIDFRRRAAVRQRGMRSLTADRVPRGAETSDVPGAVRRDEVARVYEDLARRLPPRQRAIFALKEIEGMTTEEVARTLGLRPSTVRNHLFQARRALRRELELRYPEYLPARRREEGTR